MLFSWLVSWLEGLGRCYPVVSLGVSSSQHHQPLPLPTVHQGFPLHNQGITASVPGMVLMDPPWLHHDVSLEPLVQRSLRVSPQVSGALASRAGARSDWEVPLNLRTGLRAEIRHHRI